GSGKPIVSRPAELRCLSRHIEPIDVRNVETEVARTSGLASVSMHLLASAFRQLGWRLAGARPRQRLSTIIGLDLGIRSAIRPVFRNLVSSVTVDAMTDELHDRRGLVRCLSERLNSGIERGDGWVIVELARLGRR